MMNAKRPKSAADHRPGNMPYYINKYCNKCGTPLVLNDLMENPEKPLDEVWHDEFICPVCRDELYLDWSSR